MTNERRKKDYLPKKFGALIYEEGEHRIAWDRQKKDWKIRCTCGKNCLYVRTIRNILRERYNKLDKLKYRSIMDHK